MLRTQIYSQKQQKERIRSLARRRNKPEAQLIRELIDVGLAQNQGELPTLGETLGPLLALHGKGPTDLSTRHDDYLYGDQAEPVE